MNAPDTATETEQEEQERTPLEQQIEDGLEAGKTHGEHRTAARRRDRTIEAGNIAKARNSAATGPTDGRVDNMTKRSDADVLQGHFCYVDLSNKDAKTAVEAVLGEDNAPVGVLYGVFTDVGEVDQHGYPLIVTVLSRDEHSAFIPGIPYEALSPAPQGGRR